MGAQVISQVLVLFILMAVGFLSAKLKITTKEAAGYFSSICIKIMLPCLILSSFFRPFDRELLQGAGVVLVAAFAVYAFGILLAWVYPYLLGMKGPERGVHRYALIVPNSGLIGFAVVEGVLGPLYLFHVSFFNVPMGLLAFSVGIWLITKESGNSGGNAPLTLSWKYFVNAPIVATVIGFALFFFSVPVPAPLEQSIRLLGGITTPLFMVIIGITIAQANIKRLLGHWRVYITVAARLLGIPALAGFLCYLAGVRDALLIVTVLLTAMPAATTTSVLAAMYDVAVEEASAIVILSTILCALTIPLTVILLQNL
jgi:hypothetical protein